MIKQKVKLEQGWKINMLSGGCEKSMEEYSSTLLFYRVYAGSVLTSYNKETYYDCALYGLERPKRYIYSYAYQPEQQWTDYQVEKSIITCNQREIFFHEDAYIRLTVYRACAKKMFATECIEGDVLFVLLHPEDAVEKNYSRLSYISRSDVQCEIQKTINSINEKKTENSLVFTLVTDTHYVENGNWEDTAATIRAVNHMINPDGIIHLGDMTDGMLGKDICREYNGRVIGEIQSWGYPVHVAIGNHDTNYFVKNTQVLSDEEQYNYYLKDTVIGKCEFNQLWYYVDYEVQGIRLIFLQSFDCNEGIRYGFPEEEIEWVKLILEKTPTDYRVLVFSHEAPLARLDYWASEIRNGQQLVDGLEEWHREKGKRILGFIHGHTHADYVYYEREFPIISVGCSKCEFFTDKKPDGAVCYYRELGTVSQELWDTMIIHPKEKSIDFVRFGAGIDRTVTSTKDYKTKIWAHRGASAYAPENTLEAFQLAIDMEADGIELDVQFTKDREVVVIHDETIDRTSNGHGYVADYTLEQLRQFCFNKTHPQYETAAIPTLKEVLELIKPTSMIINIELKTGINFYGGIEETVIHLVEEAEMEERVIYSSFNHYSVKRVKELRPNARVGLLYHDGIYDMPKNAETMQANAIHPAIYNMNYPQLIEKCKDSNLKVHVWTVNTEKDMLRMCEIGVDAIITNYPDVAAKVVKDIEISQDVFEKMPKAKQEIEQETIVETEIPAKYKNPFLHGMGNVYSKVRKIFVKIDSIVQHMAGK